ncbi:MAG: glycosyltransferase [Betaproteobacteria bacterium]
MTARSLPPSVSVIVPVFDGEAVLRGSLAPLAGFARRGAIAELIVVDDGSTDASARVAAELGARVIASGGRLGPGGARNRGAGIARGDVLWFVDADVVVHDDAADVLARAFEERGVAAVFGTYDDAPAAPNFLSQYRNLLHRHHHLDAEGAAETFWAGCGAVRADAFAEAGGFDAARYPRPSIEDIELGLRLRMLGHAIRLEPRLQAKHLKAWRLASLMHTDVVMRALPWTRLIVERRIPAVLNARAAERWRAALAWLLALSLVATLSGAIPPLVPVFLTLAALAANARLLARLLRARGPLFALGAGLFHQFYYLYASAAFVAGVIAAALDGARASRNSRRT